MVKYTGLSYVTSLSDDIIYRIVPQSDIVNMINVNPQILHILLVAVPIAITSIYVTYRKKSGKKANV